MAHELSIRANGKAEMAFVGDTPWHRLGQSVTKGASIGVWMKEAGMDWQANEARVTYCPAVDAGSVQGRVLTVPSHKVIYRSDTQEALGVVGDRYNIVQPRDVLEFFRDMTEEGGWYIHTAGVLRGGRKLWAMATNGQVDRVGGKKSDQVINQLLLATSLDGSMKTVVKECATVVVCANTLAMALGENGKRGVVVSHRSIFDPQAVKKALGVAQDTFDAFMRKAREMSEQPIALDESLELLRGIFGAPAPSTKPQVNTSWMQDLKTLSDEDLAVADDGSSERESRAVGRVLELFKGGAMGAGNAGRADTRWGLFNAVTQFVDHEMGRTDDTRMDSAWFGRGEQFKEAAFEALTAEEA